MLCVGETLAPDTGPAHSGCSPSFPAMKSKWYSQGRCRDSRRPRQLSEWRLGAKHAGAAPDLLTADSAFHLVGLSCLLCAMGHC